MPTYRCYFLSNGQRIIRAEIVEAEDDARAISRAQALCEVHHDCASIELWERDRRVHTYERRGNGASSRTSGASERHDEEPVN